MAASNYRVVCNLHAIMVYNAEAPLDSLYGHPVQLQPLPPSSPLSLSLSHSRSVSVVCTPVEDKDRECLHVSSRNTTVSTFNYTCMDTVPHKSPRVAPARKKYYEYFRNPLSILAPVIGRVCSVVLRRLECDFLQMRSVEITFKLNHWHILSAVLSPFLFQCVILCFKHRFIICKIPSIKSSNIVGLEMTIVIYIRRLKSLYFAFFTIEMSIEIELN